MKIILTGASSFSGYWFARALHSAGHEIIMPMQAKGPVLDGIKAKRIEGLAGFGRIVWDVPFGSDRFFEWMSVGSAPDLFCHHASVVKNHQSADFDLAESFAGNTVGIVRLVSELRAIKCRGLVFTGTYYEKGEGRGTGPLEAFSPYAVSKYITYEAIRFYCMRAGLPVSKFVMPNPFGLFEEKGFVYAAICNWLNGRAMTVRTPNYVRDNIHIELLAAAYVYWCNQAGHWESERFSPSGYAETQGAFGLRLQSEIRRRTKLSCELHQLCQTEYTEPLERTNLTPVAAFFDWDDVCAWDRLCAMIDVYTGRA